jgi:hypothetical protein
MMDGEVVTLTDDIIFSVLTQEGGIAWMHFASRYTPAAALFLPARPSQVMKPRFIPPNA